MPLLRYFLFVGGALLALLFAVDAFAPAVPAATAANASVTIDSPTLRIRSDRKWPERIVFDTSLPTIVPPVQTVAAQASLPTEPGATSEFTAKARVRESFAQFRPSDDEQKPVAKPQAKRKIARHRAAPAPQIALAAQQQRFGFFASNTW